MGAKGSSADGKRSREKGFRFEIRIANEFQRWWGTRVKRVPLSGAYGSEWGLAGDLMFGRSWFMELQDGWCSGCNTDLDTKKWGGPNTTPSDTHEGLRDWVCPKCGHEEVVDDPSLQRNKPPPFPFYVELKKRETWRAEHLFEKDTGPVAGWWRTAAAEAEHNRLRPMLIIARNRVDPLVLIREADLPAPAMFPRLTRRDWVPSRSALLAFRMEHLLTPVMASLFRDLPSLDPHPEVRF